MGFSFNPNRADVDDSSYLSSNLTVGTSAVEVFVGASRNANRQVLTIYNNSNSNIFIGPSTVTVSGSTQGQVLFPRQFISLPVGNVGVFAIAGTAGNSVIAQELS